MNRFRKIVLGGITIVTLFVCVYGCGRQSREKEVDAAIENPQEFSIHGYNVIIN